MSSNRIGDVPSGRPPYESNGFAKRVERLLADDFPKIDVEGYGTFARAEEVQSHARDGAGEEARQLVCGQQGETSDGTGEACASFTAIGQPTAWRASTTGCQSA